MKTSPKFTFRVNKKVFVKNLSQEVSTYLISHLPPRSISKLASLQKIVSTGIHSFKLTHNVNTSKLKFGALHWNYTTHYSVLTNSDVIQRTTRSIPSCFSQNSSFKRFTEEKRVSQINLRNATAYFILLLKL